MLARFDGKCWSDSDCVDSVSGFIVHLNAVKNVHGMHGSSARLACVARNEHLHRAELLRAARAASGSGASAKEPQPLNLLHEGVGQRSVRCYSDLG